MIDNFEQISKILTFNSEDEFYFLQILQRKKDNPDGYMGSNNSSRLIKGYYIKSVDELFKRKPEIIALCNQFNARAGINLNKRSYYKTAFNTMKIMAEQMHNKNYKSVHRAWNTACGIHNGVDDKIWLLDLDSNKVDYITSVKTFVNLQPPFNTILSVIPSKMGVHIITKGFDLRNFISEYPEIEVHKNNPTNLYIP